MNDEELYDITDSESDLFAVFEDLEEMKKEDKWWSSLKVSEKERIATKVAKQECSYPKCSVLWNNLDKSRKEWIHNHCVNDHGQVIPDWTDGKTYSF